MYVIHMFSLCALGRDEVLKRRLLLL